MYHFTTHGALADTFLFAVDEVMIAESIRFRLEDKLQYNHELSIIASRYSLKISTDRIRLGYKRVLLQSEQGQFLD